MIEMFLLMGEVLGPDELLKAQELVAAYQAKKAYVLGRTTNLTAEDRPSVLFLYTVNPSLGGYGTNSVQNEFMETVGGINAAEMSKIGPIVDEEVLAWDPEIIIAGASKADIEVMLDDSRWQNLQAIKNERVYIVPKGLWSWNSMTAERSLLLLWMAKVVQPDFFTDLDLDAEITGFFETFFGYSLTADEIDLILAAQPPA